MTIKVDESIGIETIEEKHAEPIFHLAKANRLHLKEWLAWVDKLRTLADFRAFVRASKKRNDYNTELSCVLLFQNKVVGRIGLYNIDHQNKMASVGYWLDQKEEGKGIVTKACKALVHYGFAALGLNRIEIKCGTGNSRSKAIPERLRSKKEGIIRQGEWVNDKFIDIYLYAMLKEEWIELGSK